MADLLQFPRILEKDESEVEALARPPQDGPAQGLLPFFESDLLTVPASSGHALPARRTAAVSSSTADSAETLRLPDPEARRAALDIRRSWIVEAPAGSGKTGLLIQRLLKLLAFGDVERPNEVLAITFTRKAAGELRNRVLEQLSAAAAGRALPATAGEYERTTRDLAQQVLARDRALGWNLLASPHTLNISTIDAFCAELAGSQPLLSAGAGRYRPVEDVSELYELAAERTILQLGGGDRPLHEALHCVLLHRDAEVRDTVQLIAGMLKDREPWGELVPLSAEELTDAVLDGTVRPRLEASLSRAVCAGLSQAVEALEPELLGELARCGAALADQPGTRGASPLHPCAGRKGAPGDHPDDLDHWRALVHLVLTAGGDWRRRFTSRDLHFEVPASAEARLRDLVAELREADGRYLGLKNALCQVRMLPPTSYPDEQWRVVKSLFRVLRRALAELNVLFAERGECDFTEIGLTARLLLRSGADILALPGSELSHLLVDEMQDTSAGQYELLELLSRSWDGATQTLFLVGDPKQSIYLFRQARVARFLRTQASGRLGDLSLGALRLTANFRSQAHLVEDFNEVFERVLEPTVLTAGVIDEPQIPFVAATPTRSGATRPALQWHARLEADTAATEGGNAPASAHAAAGDAREIRALIEDFRERWQGRISSHGTNSAPPRIAVLARSRSHLAPILAELREDRGGGSLPFRAVDIERLEERQEVLDLLALTRALLHPGDRTAWMALLRSPVCGLTLGDLLLLAGEDEDAQPDATVAHLVGTRASLLSADGQRTLARAWPVLASAQGAARRVDLSSLVERTWRSLGADAPLTPEQRTNARRYLQLLRKLEAGQDPLTLPRLLRNLKALYAEPLAGQVAVELMTIHKAKGLEWDLVIVPALDRKTGDNRHELLRWLELDGTGGEAAEVILSPIAGKGEAASRLSAWLGKAQNAREEAETKRLLYVACTRAREELHLFTACTQDRRGSLRRPGAGTLLAAAWPAAQPVLEALFRQTQPGFTEDTIRPAPAASSPLSLAAAAEPAVDEQEAEPESPRLVQPLLRLPADFNPLERFRRAPETARLYPAAESLRRRATFDRPEGSFAARAFGNVVHRFMDLASEQIADGVSPDRLQRQLPDWSSRILTSFRAEGLPPALCHREMERTLHALERTLGDPLGVWILSPHSHARSEFSLHLEASVGEGSTGQDLRADRIFHGGGSALLDGDSHLWIVDFKTAEAGGRNLAEFLVTERRKYEPQMQAYAHAMLTGAELPMPIVLALFYPLIPHLLYWPYMTKKASDDLNAGYHQSSPR